MVHLERYPVECRVFYRQLKEVLLVSSLFFFRSLFSIESEFSHQGNENGIRESSFIDLSRVYVPQP